MTTGWPPQRGVTEVRRTAQSEEIEQLIAAITAARQGGGEQAWRALHFSASAYAADGASADDTVGTGGKGIAAIALAIVAAILAIGIAIVIPHREPTPATLHIPLPPSPPLQDAGRQDRHRAKAAPLHEARSSSKRPTPAHKKKHSATSISESPKRHETRRDRKPSAAPKLAGSALAKALKDDAQITKRLNLREKRTTHRESR